MTLTEERLIELEELNIEFTETLMVATQKVLDFADKHNLEFPERIALGHLLKRAASTLNAMRDPLGHDVTKSKQNQESLQKMEPSNPYPPSAVLRLSGPARISFS